MGAAPTDLHNTEIAITGRLASMSRQEAIASIRRHNGRYTRQPKATTSMLVIGSDGPPLDRDGHPTRCLRRAQELQRMGVELEIVEEDEFVERLGDADRIDKPGETRRLYTIAQLARILEIETAEIRAWIRADLIQPVKVVKRLCYFEFGQVACARRLRELQRNAG